MKIKWGALIVDGRGKIGGHVASKNRAGAYMRTKVTPVNAQTSFQNSIRNRFTSLSQAWRGLTEANRIAWNAAVAAFARTDIFGDLHNPTGFNLHQRLNNNLLIISETAITTPPLPIAVEEVVLNSLAIAEAADTMVATMAGAVPALTNVKVYATAPMSAGISFVKSEYRLIDVLAPAALAAADIKAAYVAKFGSIGLEGQKVFVKMIAVAQTTGQVGTPSSVSSVVIA